MEVSLLRWILYGCYVFMLVNERFSIVTVTDLALEPWVAGRTGIEIKKKNMLILTIFMVHYKPTLKTSICKLQVQ